MVRENEDFQLLRSYKSGDQNAFVVFIKRHEVGLAYFLKNLLGNDASVQDVIQQTFLKVHTNIDRILSAEHPRNYLYQIAKNTALTQRRSQQRLSTGLMNFAKEKLRFTNRKNSSTQSEKFGDSVWSAVEALPMELRAVVVMKNFQSFTFDEMTDLLGKPKRSLQRLHAQALTQLKMQLEKEGFGFSNL